MNRTDERWAGDFAEVTLAIICLVLIVLALAYYSNHLPGSDAADVQQQHEELTRKLLERGY